MASIHLEFNKKDISNIVLMPGDPLRAKYIADNYLENVIQINKIRNNLGYTGYYKGKKISVIASGMGIPSMGIYAYELYNDYNVDKIIRIGTAGSMKEDIKVKDIVLATSSYSESSFAYLYSNNSNKEFYPSLKINDAIDNTAIKQNIKIKKGIVFSTDVFQPYAKNNIINKIIPKNSDFLATEMESFALFFIANLLQKEAACLLTISDSSFEDISLSAMERQESLDKMIKLALDCVLVL